MRPPGRLPLEVWHCPTGRRPRGRPRTSLRDNISHLHWERRRIPQKELEDVAGERRQKYSAKPAATLKQPGIRGRKWMHEIMDVSVNTTVHFSSFLYPHFLSLGLKHYIHSMKVRPKKKSPKPQIGLNPSAIYSFLQSFFSLCMRHCDPGRSPQMHSKAK